MSTSVICSGWAHYLTWESDAVTLGLMFQHVTLDIPAIQTALATSSVGHSIAYHSRLPSTMSAAQGIATLPTTSSGLIVVAEEQTAGRGRLQREWHAPFARGLLSTTVVKAPYLPSLPHLLPMLVGVAVVQALEATVPALSGQAWLKWPNDVLLMDQAGDAGKVAGILIESSGLGTTSAYALLGIGINVNQSLPELPPAVLGALPPTSVALHMGRPVDRTALLIELCRALDGRLSMTRTDRGADQDKTQAVYREWKSRLVTLGQEVSVRANGDGEPFWGTALDVDGTGGLVVQGPEGDVRVFQAGDVSLRSA